LLLALAFTATTGCGGKTPAPLTAAHVPAPAQPRDAAPIADALISARMGTWVYPDRIRSHPIGAKLTALNLTADLLEGTGIDVLRDAQRAYVASTGITQQDRAVLVVQHRLEAAQLRQSLELVRQRSSPPGAWQQGTQVPSVRVRVQGHERVIGLVEPDFLVVLPTDLGPQIDSFAGLLVLDEPEGDEAARARIDKPSETLRAQQAPPIPPTLARADVRVTLQADGGAMIRADAVSTDEQQAQADATALTDAIERATTLQIAIVRIRMFKRVPFRAEGNHVKADMPLSASEIDQLLTIATTLKT
jgi:hypothetical protein